MTAHEHSWTPRSTPMLPEKIVFRQSRFFAMLGMKRYRIVRVGRAWAHVYSVCPCGATLLLPKVEILQEDLP